MNKGLEEQGGKGKTITRTSNITPVGCRVKVQLLHGERGEKTIIRTGS